MAPLIKYIFFTVNYGLDLSKVGTFTHAWSLCIEEQFYLLLPLFIIVLKRFHSKKLVIILIALLFTAVPFSRMFTWHEFVKPHLTTNNAAIPWYKYIYYPTHNRLDGLLLGVGLAGLYTFYPIFRKKINDFGNWSLLLGFVVLIIAYFVCEDSASFKASVCGFTIVAFGFATIVAGAVSPNCILFHFKSKITSIIANLSYALYLSHKLIIHSTQILFEKVGIEKDSGLMFLICVVFSIIGALIIRYSIELPFLKLRKALLNKTSR